ncbi:sensor domain-containing diguanylate cyclase [Sediminibacillus massiliensis]|uniref:sensor domain-containing diguanylate cyclase n=1 Tax=Sediminibacillus massiliensis TaxID=1926277 RepID=UPI0009885BDE|nr:diguanylate cyclase [Sediminibacillus massiliensis]
MNTDYKSLLRQLRRQIVEEFINDPGDSFGELASNICMKIKGLPAVCDAGIYLFNQELRAYFLVSCKSGERGHLIDRVDGQADLTTDHIIKEKDRLNDAYSFLLPIYKNETDVLGQLFISFKANSRIPFAICEKIGRYGANILGEFGDYFDDIRKDRNYQWHYRITSCFHASIDTNEVLNNIVVTLKEVYQKAAFCLYLSQDFPEVEGLPVKELDFNDSKNILSKQAFMKERLQYDDFESGGEFCVYVPIQGRQGVYGVLEIKTYDHSLLSFDGSDLLKVLAKTAGNALENARLYQQSRQLISDLQLINETSQTLNSNLRLTETTSYMNRQIKDKFGADEIGFIMFKEEAEGGMEILEGSTDFFLYKDAQPFINSIVDKVDRQKDPVFIGDFAAKHPEIPAFHHSVMAIPMVQSQQIRGVILVLHKQAYSFTFEAFKLIQSLVHHSTLAFVNSMLREQLEYLVITDYLTGLYSRKYLDERLQDHLTVDEQGAFLLIDIDDFKKFNDTYGHELGDELIIQVSNIIKGHLDGEDFAARWGGEELAVYLPNATMDDGVDIAIQLVRQVETFTEPTVTISVGVSYWQKGNDNQPKCIFDRADKALYEAKKLGKNCVAKGKRG